MLRLVADTNICISALNFGGVPDQVLALARRGAATLFISPAIEGEIEGVLRKKFRWPQGRIREAVVLIGQFTVRIDPRERVFEIRNDEADNRVLECALATRASIIISGDSHLLKLRSFRGIRILSPRALVDTLT